jgi:hypothetical protein
MMGTVFESKGRSVVKVVIMLNVKLEELPRIEARVPDLPVSGEGQTPDEAIADLERAFRAYVKHVGLQTALSQFSFPSDVRIVDWEIDDSQPVGNGEPARY